MVELATDTKLEFNFPVCSGDDAATEVENCIAEGAPDFGVEILSRSKQTGSPERHKDECQVLRKVSEQDTWYFTAFASCPALGT